MVLLFLALAANLSPLARLSLLSSSWVLMVSTLLSMVRIPLPSIPKRAVPLPFRF
jgi:hypothetical protein